NGISRRVNVCHLSGLGPASDDSCPFPTYFWVKGSKLRPPSGGLPVGRPRFASREAPVSPPNPVLPLSRSPTRPASRPAGRPPGVHAQPVLLALLDRDVVAPEPDAVEAGQRVVLGRRGRHLLGGVLRRGAFGDLGPPVVGLRLQDVGVEPEDLAAGGVVV